MASGITGIAIAPPISNSCKAVFTFEIRVGLTTADGREKSQYRAMVFGGGSEIHLCIKGFPTAKAAADAIKIERTRNCRFHSKANHSHSHKYLVGHGVNYGANNRLLPEPSSNISINQVGYGCESMSSRLAESSVDRDHTVKHGPSQRTTKTTIAFDSEKAESRRLSENAAAAGEKIDQHAMLQVTRGGAPFHAWFQTGAFAPDQWSSQSFSFSDFNCRFFNKTLPL
ncbi:hypothetical protein CIHG_06985 [Coccidioides immitis H538.4]|uniref:Uncharacterized protein n=1 Tax=Coccidioides immitis H538.4 TaxID=396776 RepID=A0A0J8RWZ1_COCIT|nr:hypothetical protein CIHG_06985 [Coccidioides immitis H538.4]